MSGEITDETVKPARETRVFFGHTEAEQGLLSAYQSGRVPHAWLIAGEPGIGKATLAYRFARFVLANPDPRAAAVQKATSLAVDPEHPVARRVAARAETDLLALERVINEETGKLYTVIRVVDVRRTVSFFGSTAGESGWRIAIVDSVDELQREGANALLKVLEEPPQRSLLLLVSHAPGRELPTLRSRSRRLLLRPLSEADVARALAAATGRDEDDAELQAAAAAGGGSVARALSLLEGQALALRRRVLDLMAQLPDPDPGALHALGDALAGNDPSTLATFMDLVNGWLAGRLEGGMLEKPRLIRVARAWDEVNAAARAAEIYNLERKPLVFTVFDSLAQAARG
jgi:DNA polymerase III subunit delta'